MTRGTTPYISFTFDKNELDMSLVDYAEMTINQDGENVIIKKLGLDENNDLGVVLSEKETLNLREGQCKVQVKIKLKDNNVVASNIATIPVTEILNGEVML